MANAALVLAILLVPAPCCLWSLREAQVFTSDLARRVALDAASAAPGLAVMVGCLGWALYVLASHLARRTLEPLPAPVVDPLATYREAAPVECPRHPFAR